MQIINNAVRLLMQAIIFPLKVFDDWEAITPKTYPALKTFIAVVYMRCILAEQLCNTAGQQGCVPAPHNMYNVFTKENNTYNTATTTANIAALMMGSTIRETIPDSGANAVNQLSTNQTALMNQMAAMPYANVPPPPTLQYQPPIQQLTITVQQPFAGAASGRFNHGNGGDGRGGHIRQGRGGCEGRRNQCLLFVNFGCNQGVGGNGQGHFGGRIP
jgi:hypothetical protein